MISQSFAATEQTFAGYWQIAPLRAAYTDAESHHVTVLAGTGDAGATNFENDEVTYYRQRVSALVNTRSAGHRSRRHRA